jgi:DNA-binding NarL/FixJ family response regulator
MNAFTVVIAHRRAMFGEGIVAALARCPGLTPVGSVTTSADAVRLGQRADALAIDAEMPGADDAAQRLRRHGVRVVFLGSDASEEGPVTVSTDARVAQLAAALNPRVPSPARSSSLRLTRREREVLSLVAQGLAGKQVARHLGISPKTVERHKTKIFTKLAVPNAAAAVGVLVSAREGGDGAWSPSTT